MPPVPFRLSSLPSPPVSPSSPPVSPPCALCGANSTRQLYFKFDWPIARCRRCGFVYASPRAPEADILGRYTRDYFWQEYLPAIGMPGGKVDPQFVDERGASMLAFIRSRAPEARSLLEVGSGAGLFLAAAARAGWDAHGLELSEEGARFAADRFGLDVRPERAEHMSFPPGSFDVAVMFDTIEHLFEPRQVLDATRRALRPDGWLVVSTPNFNALSRWMLGASWAVLSPLEHMHYYTERTLRKMLESAGFRDVQFERHFEGWGMDETMNPDYTHAPGSTRHRLYRWCVGPKGFQHRRPSLRRAIQARGLADSLLCTARAGN